MKKISVVLLVSSVISIGSVSASQSLDSVHFSGFGSHGAAATQPSLNVSSVLPSTEAHSLHFSGSGPQGTDFSVNVEQPGYYQSDSGQQIELTENVPAQSLHFEGFGPYGAAKL